MGVPLGGTEGDITVSLGTVDIGKTGKVLASPFTIACMYSQKCTEEGIWNLMFCQ